MDKNSSDYSAPEPGAAVTAEESSAAAAVSVSPAEPWPSPAQAWYAVFVLALALMVNFLDRGILTLLVEPIKRDLRLTDVQMSLVMGFAYICFYVLLGLPVARLADYKSRRLIIGIGVAIWSVMTACCGLARSFVQLFLCRVGIGVGEACNGPASFSMLADLFPREKLPRAIAVLNFGFYAGTALSLIIGGALTSVFLQMPPKTLPVIGVVHGWQLTLFAVGLPGLAVAALMATVREPKRRGRLALSLQRANTGRAGDPDGAAGANAERKPIPVREVLRFMRQNASTFLPMFCGMGVSTVLAFGTRSWAPAFYMRTFGWSAAKFGLVQGILSLTVMPAGAFIGGLMAERLAKKGYDDANMRITVLAMLLALPGNVLYPLMPTAALAVGVSVYATFFYSWLAGPLNAALQVITPNQMRGQVTALFLFVFNVIGFGFGPTVVAVFTDLVFHSEKLIGRAMATATLILGPMALLIMLLSVRPYGRSVKRAKAWS